MECREKRCSGSITNSMINTREGDGRLEMFRQVVLNSYSTVEGANSMSAISATGIAIAVFQSVLLRKPGRVGV